MRDLLDPDDYDFYLVKELLFLFPSFKALVFPLFLCFDGVLAFSVFRLLRKGARKMLCDRFPPFGFVWKEFEL